MSKLNITPLGSKIVVQTVEDEQTTAAGIVLPDTVDKEKPQKGKVMAVGTGKKTDDGKVVELTVKVGDIVIFKKYSPDEIEVEGEEYLIMDEEDVLAIVQK